MFYALGLRLMSTLPADGTFNSIPMLGRNSGHRGDAPGTGAPFVQPILHHIAGPGQPDDRRGGTKDHPLVSVTIRPPEHKRGGGYAQFSISLVRLRSAAGKIVSIASRSSILRECAGISASSLLWRLDSIN